MLLIGMLKYRRLVKRFKNETSSFDVKLIARHSRFISDPMKKSLVLPGLEVFIWRSHFQISEIALTGFVFRQALPGIISNNGKQFAGGTKRN